MLNGKHKGLSKLFADRFFIKVGISNKKKVKLTEKILAKPKKISQSIKNVNFQFGQKTSFFFSTFQDINLHNNLAEIWLAIRRKRSRIIFSSLSFIFLFLFLFVLSFFFIYHSLSFLFLFVFVFSFFFQNSIL